MRNKRKTSSIFAARSESKQINLPIVEKDPLPYFYTLMDKAESCRLCSNMRFDRTYLNEHNGAIPADIMFVGESCAAGEIKTIVAPFVDSASGANFDKFMKAAGLDRRCCFITNAVLHSPVTDDGKIRPPEESEIEKCSKFLSAQICLVEPRIVVTLGATALRAVSKLCYHEYRVKTHVAQAYEWWERLLIPLYHPSPNTIMSRSTDEQIDDYQFVRAVLDSLPDRQGVISDSRD